MTILYKQTKSGTVQTWSIETQPNGIYTVTFGQLDGAMQTQSTQCISRNVGKANETTPEQQAELEVQALITKKLKSGYSYDQEAPVTVLLPMKVKSYQDQLHNITFPCYSTPKLNGINGLYRRDPATNQLTLYSRGGEAYPAIPHLTQPVLDIMDELNCNELNGELYIHNTPLQDIQSAVTKPNELSHKLTFNIFDISDSSEPFSKRHAILQELAQTLLSIDSHIRKYIGFVPAVICNSHEDIESHYIVCMTLQYEGTVIKLPHGLYKHNIRSSEQFKYKKTISAEFLISGFELDKRKHPVFHLWTDLQSTNTFKAKPKGTHEFLSSIDPKSYVGHWATIEYECLSKSGTPLKPIFIGLRKCDESGNPLE